MTTAGVALFGVVAQGGGAGTALAAAMGIVVLALLGGGLIVRNRVDQRSDTNEDRPAEPADDVVTDREHVRRLITENGGRMKQADIVDQVEWSKAKVSRLLADLEEDGEITKLRLGRENLICLDGYEPPASKSPE